jgi:glyoxylase-like metal-dependent hydrolase (beta-lactamase superfamily II)
VLSDFRGAREERGSGPRLRAVRKAGEALRERFASGPRALAVRTLPITTLAYPTKYAFWSAAFSPAPYVVMTHRALLVQFLQHGELKTLLFNPTDHIASRATPFFARMIEMVGDYVAFRLLAKTFEPLESQLADLGLDAESIDYVAFDHFHTQDLRTLLGTTDGEHGARFPRARLLAPVSEWEDWDDLHPMQRAWFVADGKRNVRTENVLLTNDDLELGDGVLLLRTPGHTSGNQTLFVHTPDGVWGCSENGTCADNWTPLESRIKGLAALCRRQDLDLVLNANTPELAAEQYTSMLLERTLVDRVKRAPGFCQMFPSSEVTPSALAPGLAPTILHKALSYGEIVKTSREPSRNARVGVGASEARPA